MSEILASAIKAPAKARKAKFRRRLARFFPTFDDGKALPITESQILEPRRSDDQRSDLWSIFNRVQENLVKGGLASRSANGRSQRTRPVQGIDQNIRLNRALWLLADELRRLKA